MGELFKISIYDVLERAAQILRGERHALGYEAYCQTLRANPDKIAPVHYVYLYAEAYAGSVSSEKVRKDFPDAKRLAQYLIDHTNRDHQYLMRTLGIDFNSNYSEERHNEPSVPGLIHSM